MRAHKTGSPFRTESYPREVLRQFTGRRHGPVVQFIKYGIAGSIATVIHVFLFFLLSWKVIPALGDKEPIAGFLNIPPSQISDSLRALHAGINNALAFMVSNFVVYWINVSWVFESGRHSFWKEIGLFYGVAAVSVAIGIGLQSLLIGRFGISTTYAFGGNVLICLMINYVMRKYFIFKK
ncbi:MAG: GtrA family protein [Candidatus Aureabacteria bacterium]|nr:GtrA family protein [Candidatus Auribacterota bacterium]